MKSFKSFVNEGALVDNLYQVSHKHVDTGERSDVHVRAMNPKDAKKSVEGHYTFNSEKWKHIDTKKVSD
jgi:hypothetical protein